MKKELAKELADLIMVRNHVWNVVNGTRRVVTSKDDINNLLAFCSEVDTNVVNSVLSSKNQGVLEEKPLSENCVALSSALENAAVLTETVKTSEEAKSSDEEVKPAKTQKKTVTKKTNKKSAIKRVLEE